MSENRSQFAGVQQSDDEDDDRKIPLPFDPNVVMGGNPSGLRRRFIVPKALPAEAYISKDKNNEISSEEGDGDVTAEDLSPLSKPEEDEKQLESEDQLAERFEKLDRKVTVTFMAALTATAISAGILGYWMKTCPPCEKGWWPWS